MDLRILKDLTVEIVELRILKNLGESTVGSSQLTAEERKRSPRTIVDSPEKMGMFDSRLRHT